MGSEIDLLQGRSFYLAKTYTTHLERYFNDGRISLPHDFKAPSGVFEYDGASDEEGYSLWLCG